ncbi:MAG TPA: purine-nucleoside phosphorylase [Planctomycetes bacterium]|nr:purine-nucleoside phosphorylase [Planctomycetota bacterium]
MRRRSAAVGGHLPEGTVADRVASAVSSLEKRFGGRSPTVGLVLGSGLAATDVGLVDPIEVAIADIEGLPAPSVKGHGSSWTLGRLEEEEVLLASGRVHAYEGFPLAVATIGIRVMALLGCQALVVTNAAGGIRAGLAPGMLMLINDHINFAGRSPLIGPPPDRGERIVDLSEPYSLRWRQALQARRADAPLPEGVYGVCLGPQYETASEIEMFRLLGVDAVGMSTVPEVIVARQEGMEVLGISLISNYACGISGETLSHQEVISAGVAARDRFGKILQLAIASRPR